MKAAQALALFDGLEFVTPEHIQELAVPVIAHRLALDPQARFSGATADVGGRGDRQDRRRPGVVVRRFLYRVFRSFSALQHRVRRRLTPAGQLLAAGLLAAIIVGPNTRLTVAYQAATFLAALLVVAALGVLARPPRLQLQRRLPRFATVGEPLDLSGPRAQPRPRAAARIGPARELRRPPTDASKSFVTRRIPARRGATASTASWAIRAGRGSCRRISRRASASTRCRWCRPAVRWKRA